MTGAGSSRVRTGASIDASEERAIRKWHDAHAGALHSWSARRFSDQREAEEVVQDTLVLAWRKRAQFDPERGTERSWLFGILRNVAASRHRANERHLRSVPVGDVAASRNVDVDEHDVAMDAEVVDALKSISASHRDAIALAVIEGRTVAEIARRLDLPIGTVKSRLYYGLRSLRNELEERGVVR